MYFLVLKTGKAEVLYKAEARHHYRDDKKVPKAAVFALTAGGRPIEPAEQLPQHFRERTQRQTRAVDRSARADVCLRLISFSGHTGLCTGATPVVPESCTTIALEIVAALLLHGHYNTNTTTVLHWYRTCTALVLHKHCANLVLKPVQYECNATIEYECRTNAVPVPY